MNRFTPHAVLAAAAVVLVAATVATLLRHTTRVLGVNGVAPTAFVVSVPPGGTACEAIPPAPPATRAVRMTLGVYSDPGARVRVDAGPATNGRVVRGRDGVTELPVANAANASRLCVANLGKRRLEVAGAATDPGHAATVNGRPAKGVFGVVYLSGPSETWAERAGDVLARVGYAKGASGSATGALLLVLLTATLGGALALAWRTLRA